MLSAAHARARARALADWPEADRLRGEIEAAGWKIVDRGTDFALWPATPPDLTDGEQVRYGSSQGVPSRLDEAPAGLATVVLIATDWPDDLARALAGLRATSPGATSLVIVANDPSPEQETSIERLSPPGASDSLPADVIWTSERLNQAAAINIGLRRTSGQITILLDTSLEPQGDIVTPLAQALEDVTVALAGAGGIISRDLRRFEDAPAGEVDAVEGYLQAFRRADYAQRGPLDERYGIQRALDVWWSLALRDEGEGVRPRRAIHLDGLPVIRHARRGDTSLADADRDRRSKRDFYRILDRFGGRRDLLVRSGHAGRRP